MPFADAATLLAKEGDVELMWDDETVVLTLWAHGSKHLLSLPGCACLQMEGRMDGQMAPCCDGGYDE